MYRVSKLHFILLLILSSLQNFLSNDGLIASDPERKTGIVTASSLNVRSGPSTNHRVITQLRQNDPVQIIGTEDGWFSIDIFIHVEAWVPRSYLSIDKKIVYETQVYSGPGELFKSHSKLQPGEHVSVLSAENEEWVQIKPTSAILGWVSAKYIAFNSKNHPPTIGKIQNITLNEDIKSERILIIVDEGGHADEDNQVVSITATSSYTNVISVDNIHIDFKDDESDAEDGWLEIMPTKDKNGTSKITITANDGVTAVSTSFYASVLPVNDAPFISGINDQTIIEDRSISEIISTVNEGGGSDEERQELSIEATSSNRRLISDDDIEIDFLDDHTGSIGGTISLKPIKDQVGESIITLHVSDGESTTDTSFKFTVTPKNDPPIISGISSLRLNADNVNSIITFSADEGGGADEDSQELVITAESSNQLVINNDNIKINFQDNSSDASDGSLQLIPNENVTGETTVTLTVSDNISKTDTSFIVEVMDSQKPLSIVDMKKKNPSVVRPPVTEDQSSSTHSAPRLVNNQLQILSQFTILETKEDVGLKGVPFRISVAANDDISSNNFSFNVSSSNTKLLDNSNVKIQLTDFDEKGASGLIDILPNKDKIGKARISIIANNGNIRDELILNLTVAPVNDLPTISKIENQVTDEDVPIKGIVFEADEGGGREEDIQVLEILAVSSNKTLIPNENIVINYSEIKSNHGRSVIDIIPKKNEFGLATISMQLFDGVMYNESSFSVFVNSVNDAPHAFEQTISTNPEIAITSILRGVDVEKSPLTFTITKQSTKGVAKMLNRQFGNFRYTPNENVSGHDYFIFIVNDGELDSLPARVTILIE